MAIFRIVNLRDIRIFAEAHGKRLSVRSQREWFKRAVLRHVVITKDGLQPAGSLLARMVRSMAAEEAVFRFAPSAGLTRDAALVVDWLAGVESRTPFPANDLRTVTFEQALAMSDRWHERLQSGTARTYARAIPPDPLGAPVVLTEPSLGERWSWAWLRSPEARRAESRAMGHCVGSGAYESLGPLEAILSLRDGDGVPHVTLHLDRTYVWQAAAKGNAEVPERYRDAVSRAAAIIGVRLLARGNPARGVGYGRHRRDGISIYVRRGVLHREDGPAVIRATGTREWYRDGRLHREDGPAIEWSGWSDCAKEWYREGKRHREDGPAVERVEGKWWYRDGELHREDGPAVERADGTSEWYFDGQRVAEPDLRPEMPPSTSLR
jgi:hypothetical protein